MKAYIKVIISGAVILGVGLAVLIIALGLNGWTFDGNFEMKSYECSEENSALDIEFSAGTLNVAYYDGDRIKIEYPESKDYTTTATESNGKLTVTTKFIRHWIIFGWLTKIPETKIWVPQDVEIDLSLKMNAGLSKIGDGRYGNVTVRMNAGALEMGKITCEKLGIDINAGAVTVSDVQSQGETVCDLSAGAIEIYSLSCPSFKSDISAGSLNVGKLTADNIDLDLSAGSANLCVNGIKSEYSVTVDKSAGSCNLQNQTGTADKRITAHISAGSLNFSFDN